MTWRDQHSKILMVVAWEEEHGGGKGDAWQPGQDVARPPAPAQHVQPRHVDAEQEGEPVTEVHLWRVAVTQSAIVCPAQFY